MNNFQQDINAFLRDASFTRSTPNQVLYDAFPNESHDKLRRSKSRYFKSYRQNYNLPAQTVNKRLEHTITETPTSITIQLPQTRICSLEDLVREFKIDTKIWEVESWTANKWEMGTKHGDTINVQELYQVKAKFKKVLLAANLQIIKEDFSKALQDVSQNTIRKVTFPAKAKAEETGNLLELAIFDAHFGKLAWEEESGESYDLDISMLDYKKTLTSLLKRAEGFKIEKILLVVGNDLFNIDNKLKTTTGGTPQDVDSRFPKIFKAVWKLMVDTIDADLLNIADVDIIIVPGNHDEEATFALGEVLSAYYTKNHRVTVLNSASLRKYYQWGENMLCFTHGDKTKNDSLPLLMATEQPVMWAECKTREAHIGHWHKSAVNEYNGVAVRTIKALSSTDAWHFGKGFVGNHRGGEAFVFNKFEGLVAGLNYTLKHE